MEEDGNGRGLGPGSPSTSVGQFSFAPATRTTVVTTTTTTTTTFPPVLIRPPRATQDLDPKVYPLASAPTPSALRNIRFELGGKSVVFNEPEDAAGTLNEVCLHLSFFTSPSTLRLRDLTPGPCILTFHSCTRRMTRSKLRTVWCDLWPPLLRTIPSYQDVLHIEPPTNHLITCRSPSVGLRKHNRDHYGHVPRECHQSLRSVPLVLMAPRQYILPWLA